MALYKRGSIWWMSFNYHGRHVQKSTKCKNKRDAENFERAFRTQLVKGEVGLQARQRAPIFSEAMSDFLLYVENEHRGKPNTVRSYKVTSRPLSAFFDRKRLDEIMREEVVSYKYFRSNQTCRPRSGKETKKPKILKPATVNRELALLKIFFNYYIHEKKVVTSNPVSRLKFFDEDNGQIRVVSPDEENRYLICASQPLRDFATIMIDTGMRPE